MQLSKFKLMVSKLMASLLILCGVACAESPAPYSDFTKPILVNAKAPVFTLNLPGNATTGYTWVLKDDYNREMIRPIKYHYQVDNVKLIGSGGQFQFTFRVMPEAFVVPKMLQPLHFVYLRPWDAQGQLDKTIDVQIITNHS